MKLVATNCLEYRDESNYECGRYGTGLALHHQDSDIPTGYSSIQDGSVSSDSGEPASEFLENDAVDRMSLGPPDNDRNVPAASPAT